MTMRRTIGLSLAFIVISTGAMGKAPEKGLSHHPAQPLSVKPGKSDARMSRIRNACEIASAHGSARYSARHGGRGRYRSSPPPSGTTSDTYLDPVRTVGRSETGKAAWYGLVGNYTASGERLDTVTPTAAHRSLPLSSYARVTSLDNGRSVIVKINDRGPQPRRFIIDLSPRAADEIDMRRVGVAAVIVEPVVFGPAPPTEPAPTVAELHSSGMPMEQ